MSASRPTLSNATLRKKKRRFGLHHCSTYCCCTLFKALYVAMILSSDGSAQLQFDVAAGASSQSCSAQTGANMHFIYAVASTKKNKFWGHASRQERIIGLGLGLGLLESEERARGLYNYRSQKSVWTHKLPLTTPAKRITRTQLRNLQCEIREVFSQFSSKIDSA